MGEIDGWADKFKEFALWNWNTDPLVDYEDAGRPITTEVLAQNASCLKESCVIKLGKQDLYLDMQHTSVAYFKGGPKIGVEQLRFDVADFAGKEGAGLQAIITIGDPGPSQDVRTEDWSDLDERVFCLAREDVHEVVLVASNSGVETEQRLQGKIAIEALPDHCGGGTASFTRTTSSSLTGEAMCGVSSTSEQSSSLTMVVTWDETGKGTATVNQQHHSTEVSQDVECGDGGVDTKTVSASVSGTKPTEVTWSISDDGVIDFYAGWDFILGGTEVTTTSCSPVACDSTTTTEFNSEYDALYFTAEGDPSQAVITGSFTEDNSGDGYTDVIVYSWSMER
jgi:hypothetical protein